MPGDPAATAANIAAEPGRYRLGLLGYFLAFLLDVPVAVLLYALLRRAGRTMALTAMAFRLVYTAMVGASLLAYAGAGVILEGTTIASGLGAASRVELASLSLALFDSGFTLSLGFFGVHLGLLGVLLWRSRLVPRFLGAVIGAGGVAYLIDTVTVFGAPQVNAAIAPVLVVLAMAEVILALWLVVFAYRGTQTYADQSGP